MNTQIYKLLKSSNIEDIVLGLTMWKSLDFRHFSNHVIATKLPNLPYLGRVDLFIKLDTGMIFFYSTNYWSLNHGLLDFTKASGEPYHLI